MNEENKCDYPEMEPGLPTEHEDPLIRYLHRIIRHTVRVLAVLMTLVILWGIVDNNHIRFHFSDGLLTSFFTKFL
jgi:hypothetical protein